MMRLRVVVAFHPNIDHDRVACPVPSGRQQGDLIVYDPRVLHCGSENQPNSGDTEPVTGGVRAMFTVGFRNPKVTGDFGFKGSLRTAYR